MGARHAIDDTRFPRHPTHSLSIRPAHPHCGAALLQKRALQKLTHGHSSIDFTHGHAIIQLLANVHKSNTQLLECTLVRSLSGYPLSGIEFGSHFSWDVASVMVVSYASAAGGSPSPCLSIYIRLQLQEPTKMVAPESRSTATSSSSIRRDSFLYQMSG